MVDAVPADAARTRGVEVAVFTAAAPEQIAPTMDKAKAWGATALNVLSAIYEWAEMAEEGGLIAYGARLTLIYRQLARLLAKVLRGIKPEDLPERRGYFNNATYNSDFDLSATS
jgi:putative ABC transport system substrate-binding protein